MEARRLGSDCPVCNLSVNLSLILGGGNPVNASGTFSSPTARMDNTNTATDRDTKAEEARYQKHIDNPNYFSMEGSPKGRVLIINNKKFIASDVRKGSDKDMRDLHDTFERLCGVKPESRVRISTEKNLTALEMKVALKDFAEKITKDTSFVIVVIMSHGEGSVGKDDMVIGFDNNTVNVAELVDVFKSKQSQHLADVPVLMFFQMCRGEGLEKSLFQDVVFADEKDGIGFVVNKGPTNLGEILINSLRNVLPGSNVIGQENQFNEETDNTEDCTDYTASDYVGNQKNMLVSFSTSEGQASIRNHESGSWYIQELCRNFEKSSSEKDVIALMKDVHVDVHGKSSKTFGECAIACETAHTFKKRLCFFPGFPSK